ncbi:hypothetical protein LWI29_030459 [Acer saccharum]|uniref:U5 small nuclear ribonucleoprotein TSSC4 n=1 Tax=Acer saccharum TaxID=4024 RepID=A0AA39SFD4_ACESA|nr:hypothetical protein LWI29_030459 [Acer saccharum]
MEDNFRVRVGKIFGSLSSSASPNPSSLWSLTDDEIEKNEWNRHKDEAEPETELETLFAKRRQKKAEDFSAELEKDILDLDDDIIEDDETQARDSCGSSSQSVRGDDYNDEEWEIKSNIGADCTLDYEEEEDQYDKQAVGKEKPGDRLYLKEINDYVTDACTFDELPESLKDVARDPRANHIAAELRLKEDAEAAKKIDTLRVSEKDDHSVTNAETNTSEDANPKPILKRGDTQPDTKRQKRVRFDSECKDDFDEKSKGDEAMVSNEVSTLPVDFPSSIPDYIQNPSKYTRYTFDSEDMDEKSNREAYMDFLNMVKKSNTTESPNDEYFELPKTVTFIPKRKTGDIAMAENDTKSKQNQDGKRGLPISITAGDEEVNEVCAMEEDEPETVTDKLVGYQKSGRKYRMKAKTESE